MANKFFVALCAVFLVVFALPANAAVVYNSTSAPAPLPPNVVSEGFQCCQNSEIGNMITLESGPRHGYQATIIMSDWAVYAGYIHYAGSGVTTAGFTHPITLSMYVNAAAAENHQPFASFTVLQFMPWRPADDPHCSGSAWYMNGTCYHGFAFPITFNLGAVTLPDSFVYGIAFNTNTWGYHPLRAIGPYESLNVGLSSVAPSVGTNANSDEVWQSLGNPAGPFMAEDGWSPYTPAIQFDARNFPASDDDCKSGAKNTGWQNLMRTNGTPFANQGACVNYVRTGQ